MGQKKCKSVKTARPQLRRNKLRACISQPRGKATAAALTTANTWRATTSRKLREATAGRTAWQSHSGNADICRHLAIELPKATAARTAWQGHVIKANDWA